jgi:PAS domain S-box-containing protein
VGAVTDHALYTLGLDGLVTTWNPGAERLKLYKGDEVVGRHYSIFYTEEDQQAGKPQLGLDKARELGRFADDEWRVRKDSSKFWAHIVIDPMLDDCGCLIGFAIITRDCTDRLEAQNAVRKSEEEFRKIFDSVSDGIFVSDSRRGDFIDVNEMGCAMFGYSRSELIGHNIGALSSGVPPYSQEGALLWFKKAQSGLPQRFEWHCKANDGHLFWVEISLRCLNLKGRDVGLASLRDITERKQRAAALLASELRYRRLFEAAQDGILILDESTGEITDVNPFLIDLLGYTREEYLGKRLWEIGFLKDVAASQGAFEELRNKGYIRYENLPLETKNGQKAEVEFVSNSYFAEGLRVIQCNIRDITKRKRTERELQESEAKLRKSQRLELVGQLAGGIAHDFNNQLGVVIGNLDLILDGAEENAGVTKLVRRALDGAMHATEMTKRLLAFSRKQLLAPSVVALNEMLPLILPMLERTLGEQITVELRAGPGLWLCEIDSSQLEDTILNLAINARDAMPRGGRLLIETDNVALDENYASRENELEPGDYVRLAISDTGTGMTPEILQRAFEPFFTTKDPDKGTGLGLSMVYGFVKQSKGHAKIYSELGYGTTVKLYLPRAMAVHSTAVEPSPIVEAPRGTETILVVEDNKGMRQVALDQLAGLGYLTLEASNAKDALVLLAEHPEIALLFSDVVMPGGMTGYDLVREARKRRPGLKVLLTSGYTSPSLTAGDADTEGLSLISKPFRMVDLAIGLRRILADA